MIRSVIGWGAPMLCALGVNTAEPVRAQVQPSTPNAAKPERPSSEEPVEAKPRIEWMRLGPFGINPRIGAQVVYDDNITIHSQNKLDDLIWVFSPGIAAVAGDTVGGTGRILTLDYSPS